MKELKSRTIDGHEYQFSQFGAKQSLKLLVRLSKILGEPLSKGLAALKPEAKLSLGTVLDSKVSGDAIGGMVAALTNNLDADEVLEIVETLVGEAACLCDEKKVVFNTHFAGRLGHLMKVLYAALEVQYGNFFEELTASVGPIRNNTTTPAS
jgi:NAD/NADP transhydrogenase beta subunit